ncbi:MAG: 6,7-dimethyl-8-ribityllumazine synthase [Actinomycetota bacterium]|nr:6,7-dimethyl-8-ribityllumazine synthase [Actinomycetota bacterium]
MNIIKGGTEAEGLRLGIVVSRFNEEITKRLLDGAMKACKDHNVDESLCKVVSVPGAFEIPGAAKRLASTGAFDAIVCIGAVIRGETEHFTFVCDAAARGILEVGLQFGLPVTFGVLTTQDADQALERAGGEWGNKGYDVTVDAIEMANLYKLL